MERINYNSSGLCQDFRVRKHWFYKLEDTFAHNQPPGPRVIDEVVKSNETSVNVAQEGVDSSIKSRFFLI